MKMPIFAPRARTAATTLILAGLAFSPVALHGQKNKAAPKAAPAARPAARSAPAARAGARTTRTGGTTTRPRTNAGDSRGVAHAGARTTSTAHGGQITRSANGRPASFHAANGNSARFDSHGHVAEVHAGNTTIMHGPGGTRRIVAEGPNHTRYVTDAHGHGYVQRPYMYHGHAFEGRTYYRNGIARREFYRSYYYHGVYLNGYYPARFYAPAFYGWAYAPWAAPVSYPWGWGAAPWYGYYGPYFAPYPVYATASLWLTDYLISQSLQQAYAAGVQAGASGAVASLYQHPSERGAHLIYASYSLSGPSFFAGAPGGGAATLTPQIKQAIASEVSTTLDEEKSEAAQSGDASGSMQGIGQLLADGKTHVFLASEAINVPDASGQDCAITAGDVLQMNAAPPEGSDSGQLQVLASKGSDCQQGSTVTITLENLQEMHNNLMSTVDQGLGDLQKKAGTDGLPAAPAGSSTVTDAPYAAAAPPEDPNGAQELAKVATQGVQDDQQVTSEANSDGAPPLNAPASNSATYAAPTLSNSGPITISIGQSPAQVIAGKGQPRQIVKLGAKQIYVYPDIKIYFQGGKVVDVR